MVHVVFSTALFALTTGASLVAAGPCGYGALCGRSACDAATVTAYKAALPQINACGASFDGYSPPPYPAIESEATLRRLCLSGACGAAFKTFVKFYDIQSQVCELHYPTRLTSYLDYGPPGFPTSCLSNYGGVSAYPALDAEIKALLAQARGTAVSTTSPPATNAPVTQAPSPATTKPPTPAPAPVTATPEPTPPPTTSPPATLEPTTETPSPVATTESNTTTDGSREDISATTAEPQAADVTNSPTTTLPSPSPAKTSLAASTRSSVSMLCATALVAAVSVLA